ncbi:hypothetical protein GYO_2416 [Bacillus spizizenii TU-B-10]|uniref:Uncharacterized protein n=1 Tax=Bacillus spizizenii (strain DSM 15029 / JCM 12233 / NBRC 101239 / NRRL B-23049 / TU-B-10) TaxID=1052585 RepID=G4NSH5_BACS4|nr:hypothetical protein GYO_2416 [Bacillus spizizenii TU-B-10]
MMVQLYTIWEHPSSFETAYFSKEEQVSQKNVTAFINE